MTASAPSDPSPATTAVEPTPAVERAPGTASTTGTGDPAEAGTAGTPQAPGAGAGTAGSDVDIAELAHRLRLSTARLARLLRQQSGTGLSPSQHSVLVSVYVHKSVTLGELAAVEQVAPPTITKIVAKLEEEGLLSRTVDARDRRVARISISEAGRARLLESRDRRNAWLARKLEAASPEDVRRLAAAIDVLESLAGPGRALPPGPS